MEAFVSYEIISGIANFLNFRFKGNYILIAGLGKKIYSCQLSTNTTQKGESHVQFSQEKRNDVFMLWKKPDNLVPDVQTLDAAIHYYIYYWWCKEYRSLYRGLRYVEVP